MPRHSGNPSAEHLHVRLDGAHSAGSVFAFERQGPRARRAFVASGMFHATLLMVALLLFRYSPNSDTKTQVSQRFDTNTHIVWFSQPGAGGGGGGGGNQMQAPPRHAEQPGTDTITVPVAKPPRLDAVEQSKEEEPNPIERLDIPAKNLAAALESLPGAIDGPPAPPTLSQGPGTGGGVGPGRGRGIGPGIGSGLGPGIGGGTNGGPYRPGNGVTMPRLIREVQPHYTSDAMRARVQGTVLLECTVTANGDVTDIKILRSLDATFGLDQEAIKAARQWRFSPGIRLGEPVPVSISIEISFGLR